MRKNKNIGNHKLSKQKHETIKNKIQWKLSGEKEKNYQRKQKKIILKENKQKHYLIL